MIIQTILKYLVEEINKEPPIPSNEDFAKLGNIARLDSTSGASNAELQSKVIVTLVNISEELSLKNSPHYFKRGDTLEKRNPTLYLNLFILISCAEDVYENALAKISHIIGLFQQKNIFTADNASVDFPSNHVEKIILDLYSLNFEQMNNLWGILGGKYSPSALYRIRLVPVLAKSGEPKPEIKEIKATENAN